MYFVNERIGVIIENTELMNSPGSNAIGIDELVDVLGVEAAGPDVQETVMCGLVLDIGMEVDRGDGEDEVLHLLRMQRGVTGREDATFADAEQRNLVVPGLLRDPIDGGIDIIVDVVVDGEPALGSAWLAPVDQPEIEPLRQQASHQRAIGLKIGHRVSADQTVGEQARASLRSPPPSARSGTARPCRGA